MEKGMTLRSIYEYSSLLVPLENSKMANVLGINALVFLSDGTLLMPLRGNGATYGDFINCARLFCEG